MVSPRIHRINQHSDKIYGTDVGGNERTYVHSLFNAMDININLHRPFTWLLMQVLAELHNSS